MKKEMQNRDRDGRGASSVEQSGGRRCGGFGRRQKWVAGPVGKSKEVAVWWEVTSSGHGGTQERQHYSNVQQKVKGARPWRRHEDHDGEVGSAREWLRRCAHGGRLQKMVTAVATCSATGKPNGGGRWEEEYWEHDVA